MLITVSAWISRWICPIPQSAFHGVCYRAEDWPKTDTDVVTLCWYNLTTYETFYCLYCIRESYPFWNVLFMLITKGIRTHMMSLLLEIMLGSRINMYVQRFQGSKQPQNRRNINLPSTLHNIMNAQYSITIFLFSELNQFFVVFDQAWQHMLHLSQQNVWLFSDKLAAFFDCHQLDNFR